MSILRSDRRRHRVMTQAALNIPGAYLVTHDQHCDDRGVFATIHRDDEVAHLMGGRPSESQFNINNTRRGVIRGIHVTRTPPGQAKLATCLSGRALQVVVDLRLGSPTFSHAQMLEMDSDRLQSVFCPPGVGHAILALSDDVLIGYLVSRTYVADNELVINPLDPAVGIPWPGGPFTLSVKDRNAPGLAEAYRMGILPHYRPSLAHLTARM